MTKPKVLIADDDEEILKAMSMRLKANGYEVVWAVDAVQALMRARQQKPDVAIVDVYMPAGDGMSVIEKFGKFDDTWDIPVILVSADGQAATRERAESSGAKHFLTKPFDTKELLACLEDALGDRQKEATVS